ncbi:MAG: trypsin-like peptidase domain-containing protein [Rubrimonas sp.]
MTYGERILRRLGGRGPGLERAGGGALDPAGRAEMLRAHLARAAADGDLAARVCADARAGLDRLAAEGAAAALSPAMLVGLEAVILADGSRPALILRDGRLDPEDPDLGDWAGRAMGARLAIARVAASVGRVNLPAAEQGYVGTAFAVGDGLVATNRHVLEALADPCPAAPGGWRLKPGAAVDFLAEKDRAPDPARVFAVAAVAWAAPDPIAGVVDPAKLDLALLRLAPGTGPFPPKLTLAQADPAPDAALYVLGFPGRPAPGAESAAVLERLFAHVYGVKRWAPGHVELALGAVAGDADPQWTFGHDASTLGGNSGACVVDLADGETVIGLHFGGRRRLQNYAHAVARILPHLAAA